MNSESIRLAWAGALIGVLALSAAAAARARPLAAESRPFREPEELLLARTESALPWDGQDPTGDAWEEDGAAIPVMAEQTEARSFTVALRMESALPEERLFLCDEAGCPLEQIEPDAEGDAAFGPLFPGQYLICAEQEELGRFRLLDDAALEAAAGRVWTDGELLHLERFVPGTARLDLSLPDPGYYSVQLCDRDGRTRTRDFYIPDSELPGAGRRWFRSVEFPGLPPGLYTAARQGQPLGQLEVPAGDTAALELMIDAELP